MKIIINPDRKKVKEVKKQLKENDGYCPCALIHSPQTKCICKRFKDKVAEGYSGECDCGLYISKEENEDEI